MFKENESDFLKETLEKCGLNITVVSSSDTNLKIDETKSLTFEEMSYSTRIKKILLPLISVN